MDRHDDMIPGIDWEILSDALGGIALGVLFLAALALPHLF
jgi:hypothetical protein